MTDEELNKYIATEIMGWGTLDSVDFPSYDNGSLFGIPMKEFLPTTNLNQAWEALEKWLTGWLEAKGWEIERNGYGSRCTLYLGTMDVVEGEYNHNPAKAICLALQQATWEQD